MGGEKGDIPLGVRNALRGRMWASSHDVEEARPPVGQCWGGIRPEKTISARIPRLGADLNIILPGDEPPGAAGAVGNFASAGIGELEFQLNLFVTVRTYHAREVIRQLRNNPSNIFPHIPAPIYNLRIRSRTADRVPSSS